MKKIILTLALVLSIAGAVSAQADGQSIGLRLGYPTELSYQKALSNSNRLELGLGFRSYGYGVGSNYSRISLSGVYQWVWDLSSLADGFNWYAGVGASVGYYSYSYMNYTYSALPVSILGQVGIEYNFNIPIRLSLDYRPAFQLNGNGNGFVGDGIALGVRYCF
ncbi:MAG TPA: hypothetical protein VI413_02045 [Paludibacter sp.]